MTETKKEYLGVVQGPSGGGSFYRAPDKDQAARGALRIFNADFKHIYGSLKKGTECPVNIYDVTGLDVTVGEDGCWAGETRLALLEVMKVKV